MGRPARRLPLAFASAFVPLLVLLLTSLVGTASLFVPGIARAARLAGLYQETVAPTQGAGAAAQDAQFHEALRRVLVRMTGMREAASDASLAGIVADARKYVQGYRSLANGALEVAFDGAALERAVKEAGRHVWNPDRPLVLVILRPAPAAEFAQDATLRVQQVAASRGLPVSLALGRSLSVEGAAAERASLLPAAQRLGGGAVLLGRGDGSPQPASWQWTLHSPVDTQSWGSSLEEGVQRAADALARLDLEAASQPEARQKVEVSEVRSVAHYAALVSVISTLPGVQSVAIEEARADGTLLLEIAARTADPRASLAAALAVSGALEPLADAPGAGGEGPNAVLRYRFIAR